MKNTIKISALKQIIREEITRCLNEKRNISMQREFIDTVHLNLGNPLEPPDLDHLLDTCEKIYRIIVADAGKENSNSGYMIANAAYDYYKQYFPDFYQDMKKTFS